MTKKPKRQLKKEKKTRKDLQMVKHNVWANVVSQNNTNIKDAKVQV